MNLERVPSDRHGRIQLLQKSCPSPLWASLSLRPSHQDACERSHCQGRAKSSDRRRVAIGREAARLRGLLETEHVFRRTAESHDLSRRTLYHARWKERLEDHLELLRCYYNFVRPHKALKFGAEVRTPAMQAGLTTRQLTLRKIFPSAMLPWLSEKLKLGRSTVCVIVDDKNASLAA